MKRSGPLKRKTPMARGTKQLARSGPLKASKAPAKRSRPKMTPIRKSARGEACTLHIPGVCNWDQSTTVWAHSNNYRDGKGAGIKARDEEGCYACFDCHAFYDGGYANAGWARETVEEMFDRARARSQAILRQKGLMP